MWVFAPPARPLPATPRGTNDPHDGKEPIGSKVQGDLYFSKCTLFRVPRSSADNFPELKLHTCNHRNTKQSATQQRRPAGPGAQTINDERRGWAGGKNISPIMLGRNLSHRPRNKYAAFKVQLDQRPPENINSTLNHCDDFPRGATNIDRT